MKTKLLLIFIFSLLSLLLFTSCEDPYKGPLYQIEVTYDEELFTQIDTLIVGDLDIRLYNGKKYLYDKLNEKSTNYIKSFRILKRIPSRFNNETLAIEYYNSKNREEAKEKVKERDKDKWWNK